MVAVDLVMQETRHQQPWYWQNYPIILEGLTHYCKSVRIMRAQLPGLDWSTPGTRLTNIISIHFQI